MVRESVYAAGKQKVSPLRGAFRVVEANAPVEINDCRSGPRRGWRLVKYQMRLFLEELRQFRGRIVGERWE